MGKIKQYEEVFFSLLRAGIWGTEVEVPQGFDQWGSVVRLAKIQSVLSLVGDVMLRTPSIAAQLKDDMKAGLKAFVMNSVATHSMLNGCLIKVVSELRSHGIEGVLLKGQGIARNYPVTELRQCGDIDFYVGKENYLKAVEVLGKLATWKEDGDPQKNTKHYDIRIGKVTVEIHRFSDVNASSHYDRIYQKYSDKGLTENLRVLDFAGTSVNTPADDFNAFYIFNHLLHHFLARGVGLRQFCDWMLFLHRHHASIDRQALERILNEMDMMLAWQSLGCVLVKFIGLPQEEFPFYDQTKERKCDRILQHVLTEGNFGHERSLTKNRKGEAYLYRKIKSFFLHIVRYCQIFIIFPSLSFRQFISTVRIGFKAVWEDLTKKK